MLVRMMKAWMMKLMGLPSCQEIEQFAYAYLEQQLESDLAGRFERHLQGCRDCERFIDSYRRVARPEGLLQKIPLDPGFERRVVRFLKDQARV